MPEKCWGLRGSLRSPTGSTQGTRPCWSRTAARVVPMRWPGDTKGAEAWETSWGHADDAPLISCTHRGSAGSTPKSPPDQHHGMLACLLSPPWPPEPSMATSTLQVPPDP